MEVTMGYQLAFLIGLGACIIIIWLMIDTCPILLLVIGIYMRKL